MASIPEHFQRQDRMTVNGSMPRNPICVVCKKSARLCCRRCGDFYCSAGCQNVDWPSHRYICFRMPVLVSIEEQYSNDMADIISLPDIKQPNAHPYDNDVPNNNYHKQQQLQNQMQFPQQLQNQMKFPQQIKQQQKPPQQQQHQKHQSKQQYLQAQGNFSPEVPTPQRKFEQRNNTTPLIAEYPLPNSTVIVTGFRSSNMCSIVSADPTVYKEYTQILQMIADYGITAPQLQNPPTVNSCVITNLNGKYCRAVVQNTYQHTKFRLFFKDIGLEGIRNFSELRQISLEINTLKQHALPVQLSSLPMKSNFGQANKFYNSLKDKECKIVYSESKNNKTNVPHVELFNLQTGISLNQQILQYLNKDPNDIMNNKNHNDNKSQVSLSSQKADMDSKESLIESTASTKTKKSITRKSLQAMKSANNNKVRTPLLNPPFAIKKWGETGTQVVAVVVDTSGLIDGVFGCVKDSDMDNLIAVTNTLAKFKPNDEPFEPVCDEYCVGLYEEKWYRAKCIDIKGENFVVEFIDFTNLDMLTKDKIRPYPMDCTLDCRSVLCGISELENVTEEQIEFMKDWGIFEFSNIVIDKFIIENNDKYWIEINDLLTKMRLKKLLS